MSSYLVREATRDLTDFHRVEKEVYSSDPYYISQNQCKTASSLFRSEFQASQKILVVYDSDRPIARLVTRLPPHSTENQKKYGLLGFFEAHNHPSAVNSLFDRAILELQSQGATHILGPIDGDTWHRYRLNVGPHENPPFHLEPYNPPYYANLWENFGFTTLEEYFSTHILDLEAVTNLLKPEFNKANSNKITFRPFEPKRYEDELDLIHNLTTKIFADNFLYSPISRNDFGALYNDAKRLIIPELVWFAYDSADHAIGFIFAFPDFAKAARSMHGKTTLLAKLRFLTNARYAKTVNMKTLGVVKTARGSGAAGALMYLAHFHALRLGFEKVNHCLIKKGNPSGRFNYEQGDLLRTYRLYELKNE